VRVERRASIVTLGGARVAIAFEPVTEARIAELGPSEAALLGPSAVPKRRAELATGRAAARAAVTALYEDAGSDAPPAFAVLRDEGARAGSPLAVDVATGCALDVAISIAHVDGVAVAAAAWARVGIDLVTLEPLGAAFADEAFCAGEREAWAFALGAAPDDLLASCIAFGAKEAALKWLGTGLRAPLHGVRVTPRTSARSDGALELTVDVDARAADLGRVTLEARVDFRDDKVLVLFADARARRPTSAI
jgi:4'-phosphopantetheinyl transferase EntD